MVNRKQQLPNQEICIGQRNALNSIYKRTYLQYRPRKYQNSCEEKNTHGNWIKEQVRLIDLISWKREWGFANLRPSQSTSFCENQLAYEILAALFPCFLLQLLFNLLKLFCRTQLRLSPQTAFAKSLACKHWMSPIHCPRTEQLKKSWQTRDSNPGQLGEMR